MGGGGGGGGGGGPPRLPGGGPMTPPADSAWAKAMPPALWATTAQMSGKPRSALPGVYDEPLPTCGNWSPSSRNHAVSLVAGSPPNCAPVQLVAVPTTG